MWSDEEGSLVVDDERPGRGGEHVVRKRPFAALRVGYLGKAASWFFQSTPRASSSVKKLCEELDISRQSFHRNVGRLAEVFLDTVSKNVGTFFERIRAHCLQQNQMLQHCMGIDESDTDAEVPTISPALCIPRMFLKVRQYDETPIQLNVESSANNPLGPGRQKEVAKMLVTQSRWACVMEVGGQVHHFESFWPTWLQVLQNTQAETMVKALQATSTLPAEQCLHQLFPRRLHVVTTDAASSNLKAERLLCGSDASWGLLHLLCDVHRIHRVAGGVFDTVPEMTTGMIRVALSLRAGATMSLLRAALREHLKKNLVIKHGFRSDASTQRCKALMRLFMSSPRVQHHKEALDSLLNGDWAVSPEVQHYCNGCCNGPHETLEKVLEFVVSALAGSAPHIFPRHKWIGAERTLEWLGIFTVVHRLLPTLVATLFAPAAMQDESACGDVGGENPADQDAVVVAQASAVGSIDWAAVLRGACNCLLLEL